MSFEMVWDLVTVREAKTYVVSDIHWDNPDCDRRAFKRVLEQAIADDAPIIINGDFFCAMQGKYDPRGNKGHLRKEHQTVKYFDSLVDSATAWLKPYAKNIVLIGNGNHETSTTNRHETALLDRLCYKLRAEGGITLEGGYHGFIRTGFKFDSAHSATNLTEVWYFHHGWGGGGPVTKGTIDFNRIRQGVDADVYLLGHVHRLNRNKDAVMRINSAGTVHVRDIDFIRTSTFKQEGTKPYGWAVERNMGARPIGGWVCRHVARFPSNRVDGKKTQKRRVDRFWTEVY